MRLAVIADIHGNLPALEAVLADIERRGADRIVNLGDCVSGPLWPRETMDLLDTLGLPIASRGRACQRTRPEGGCATARRLAATLSRNPHRDGRCRPSKPRGCQSPPPCASSDKVPTKITMTISTTKGHEEHEGQRSFLSFCVACNNF